MLKITTILILLRNTHHLHEKKDDILQGEFQKIKAPTFEGDLDDGEKEKQWLLGMSKYFEVHDYSNGIKS